ncbi:MULTISPECIES: hypothetical protein [Duncaniella]|jgi:hypothetical protein|nr:MULTISPECIES: hypothetical protein [Duncaniella]ROS91972.1 hypothetical protein EEL34_00655 [Muribaculaceae bacterium Isolate-039 (Harlan)]ROT00210.1 hypothetical protein EEL40_01880 [Muribaculaceae bacterium Isolate-083 (Janvier)]ROT00415.1 hypothetical protein EEL37_00395 [Muribaculaceae bacterium Isolate-077 (Janvier)]ROT02720.1 hypothetical protein EEL41_00395 [Muribaculaceae bacterium Isolate-084 (Janvier)]QCD38430.1 hypothetical protein E7745_02090 [Duncaniella sp. C9]
MKIKSFLLLAVMAMTAAPAALAQTTSPYSKFGYGLLGDNATSAQRQMGGVGYAMRSGRQINVMNPASYAAIDSLTFLFDMGTDVSMYWRKDNTGSSKDWGGGLEYVTMQFPVTSYIGVSAGILPYSSVGYAFGSDIENGVATHQGTGGINQLYLGAGVRPFKNFTVGFNASYLFGNTFNDVYAVGSTSSLFEQVMEVQDFHFQFGMQYTLNLSRKNDLTLGVTYSPGKTLLGKTYVLKYDTSQDSKPDTVASTSLRNKFSIADTWGVGINYEWNKQFQAEVDFTYQNWAKAKFTEIEDFSSTKFDNRWRIGAGVSYIPNPHGGYFKRITYRAGGFYNRDYVMVKSKDTYNNVRDYGFSCGFGFPTVKSKNVINLGFEYHHRQSTPNALLTEQYFNITLGINFNGLWFFQPKLR